MHSTHTWLFTSNRTHTHTHITCDHHIALNVSRKLVSQSERVKDSPHNEKEKKKITINAVCQVFTLFRHAATERVQHMKIYTYFLCCYTILFLLLFFNSTKNDETMIIIMCADKKKNRTQWNEPHTLTKITHKH